MKVQAGRGMPRSAMLVPDGEGGYTLLLRLSATVDHQFIHEVRACLTVYDQRHSLTYAEAAAELGVSTKWLQRRVRAGTIPCHRLGSRVRFSQSDMATISAISARAARSGGLRLVASG